VELCSFEKPSQGSLLRDLFERRGPWIYALVSWIVPDRELARMLVIETFWRASQNARVSALEPQALSVWLRLQARTLAIDSLRGQPPSVVHPADFRSDYLGHVSDLTRISVALLKLAPHEREVFELAYFEGLSHSEIAAITGRSLGTIKTWVRSSRLRVATGSASDQMQNEP
jgi:RNA polymerase sigma-70 factor, ECF subfamily